MCVVSEDYDTFFSCFSAFLLIRLHFKAQTFGLVSGDFEKNSVFPTRFRILTFFKFFKKSGVSGEKERKRRDREVLFFIEGKKTTFNFFEYLAAIFLLLCSRNLSII